MQKIKALIIAPTLASYPFLRPLCLQMAARGWDVHLATSSFQFSQSTQIDSCVTHHVVGFPRGADVKGHLAASKELRLLVDELRPDVIDVHFSAAMLTVALAKRKHWPPTLATVQGLRFTMQAGLVRRQIEKTAEVWAGRRMDEVVVLTPDDFEAIEGLIDRAKLQVAPGFGCDLDRFDPGSVSDERRMSARERAGVDSGEVVVTYVGRRIAFKGFNLVIQAFVKAQREVPNLRLLICGDADPFHASGLTEEEERAVESHPQITQLGWVGHVEDFLSISDFLVFPSSREGMAVNLMEALAMGVPVITCEARGCSDIVDHEVTGVVLPDFDTGMIGDAMSDLAKDPERRNRYSRNAIEHRDRFDRDHFVTEKIEDLERWMQ